MYSVRSTLATTPKASASSSASWVLRVVALVPVAAAGAYPWLLRFAHAIAAERPVADSLDLAERAVIASLLMFIAPAAGLWLVLLLSRLGTMTLGDARLRAVSTLVLACPPLFTLIGVECWLAGAPHLEDLVWLAIWLPLALVAWCAVGQRSPLVPRQLPRASVRVAHGIMAAVLLVAFIGLHLSNHFTGLFSAEMHLRVMQTLRHWYRSVAIESTLILLFTLQIVTGAVLARRWLARSVDSARALQAATGAYLGLYLVCHLNSVFVYARANGIDTDFWFASGGRDGLMADAWNIRLVPHYGLAVLFLCVHLGAGLRVVLRAHGHTAKWVMPSAWSIGVLAGFAGVLPLLRVHLA